MAQQQKILMYALPFIFVITGPNFPVGVLIYWTTTNLWTMGQQFYVIRNNPTPGSEAAKQLEARKEAKRRKKAIARGEDPDVVVIDQASLGEIEEKKSGQRQQPKRKNRGGAKPATIVEHGDVAADEPEDKDKA